MPPLSTLHRSRAETETTRAETETTRAETETTRAETESIRAETESIRAETGLCERRSTFSDCFERRGCLRDYRSPQVHTKWQFFNFPKKLFLGWVCFNASIPRRELTQHASIRTENGLKTRITPAPNQCTTSLLPFKALTSAARELRSQDLRISCWRSGF
jgi:hypothetical protein